MVAPKKPKTRWTCARCNHISRGHGPLPQGRSVPSSLRERFGVGSRLCSTCWTAIRKEVYPVLPRQKKDETGVIAVETRAAASKRTLKQSSSIGKSVEIPTTPLTPQRRTVRQSLPRTAPPHVDTQLEDLASLVLSQFSQDEIKNAPRRRITRKSK
jgi:hypothetical protein